MRTSILLLLLLSIASPCAAATITLVADAWPPYNNAVNDPQKGYIVEIAEHIFNHHGHTVTYKILPWKVAVEETRKGTYDGLIGADTEDGAGFIFPQEEVGSYQVAFFVKKDTPWRFTSTRSLEQIKLGVAEGYGYSAWLFDYIQANKKDFNRVQAVSGEHPLRANIRKLIAGQIDATTATTSTMYYTAKQLGVSEQIQFAGSGGQGRNVYLVFSPAHEKSREYAQLFDEGLRELRSKGLLAEILSRYGLTDWK